MIASVNAAGTSRRRPTQASTADVLALPGQDPVIDADSVMNTVEVEAHKTADISVWLGRVN